MRARLCFVSCVAVCQLWAAVATAQTDPAMSPIQDDPELPRVLLIGDSISIGYTLPVRELLAGKANVHRVADNCGPTTKGIKHLDAWLGSGRWDVIHFNWGIWDTHILDNGQHRVPPEQYESNLRQLVSSMKATGARLIWASTTPLRIKKPAELRGEGEDSSAIWDRNLPAYEAAARRVMKDNDVLIDDLYNAVMPRLDDLQGGDGVHFKPEGYQFLAQIVARKITEALDSRQGPFQVSSSDSYTTPIVCRTDAPLAHLMAERLATYLELRTGSRPNIVREIPGDQQDGVVFVLGLEADPEVRAVVAMPDMDDWRDDGYAIRTVTRNRTNYVICAGKAETGIKYSVYRLMREMTTKGMTVTVPPLWIAANPFFKGRLALLGSGMAGGAPPLIQKHYAWVNWPVSRMAVLPDFLDAAGMNGIMCSDSPARYDWTGRHITPQQLAVKQRTLSERTHANGMTFCMLVHGTSNIEAGRLSSLQPRDPQQLELILEYYDGMAEKYGAVTDLLWTQWADPGGAPPPADITDPQKLHLEIVKRFEKKRGGPIEAVFSAHGLDWRIGPGGSLPWAGYEGPQTLTGGGILPSGTCIGGVEMRLYPVELDFARQVRAGGFRYGIFGWLVSDYEMNPGIHVHTHIMDNYFRSIPAEARNLVDWYEEGLVYSTMNPASFYVFAQMLWDPHSSADQHLMDYCLSAFGPDLAPLMLKGYRAIADVRCGPGTAEERGMCRLGRGSSDPAQDLAICEDALAALEGAYADNSYLPTIPMIVPAEAMINDLRAQLEGMARFARFRIESSKVATVIASGGSEQEIREAIASLPGMETWPGSPQPKTPGSWGQPEFFQYSDTVNYWERHLQQLSVDGAPSVTGRVLFADDFSKYPAGADGRPNWQAFADTTQDEAKAQWMTERETMSVDIPGEGGRLARATGVLLAGEENWKNYSIQARVRLVQAMDGGSVGLRIYVTGGERPQSQSGYAIRLSDKQLKFGWLSAGTFKLLQAADLSFEAGSWQALRVDCRGHDIGVYLNGRLLMGTNDYYGPASGRVGLEVCHARGAFDDVSVRELAP